MRKLDAVIIAVWAAVIFGLAEGVALNVARAYPTLLAPYKASAHMLWIAPLVDLPLFVLAALGLLIVLRLARKWTSGRELLVVYAFFIFLGIFTVVEAPKLINLLSVALLSLGLTVVLFRKLRGSEKQLTIFLRQRIAWLPLLIVVAGLGVYGYEQIHELWQFQRLSVAPAEAPTIGEQ